MFFYSVIKSGASVPEIIIALLAFVLAVSFSIIMHEISHGYVALWNGDRTAKDNNRLTINPLAHFDLIGILMFLLVGFGWAKPVPVNPRNYKNRKLGMVTVSLAGVVTNLVLGGFGLLLLYFLAPFLNNNISSQNATVKVLVSLVFYLLFYGIQINFMLAFFNLLPIYPLDGFNLLNTFLPPFNKYQRFMVRYGILILLGLMLLGNLGELINFPYLDIFGLYGDLIYNMIYKVLEAGLGM